MAEFGTGLNANEFKQVDHLGTVIGGTVVKTFTPVLDTSIYADADVLFVGTELTGVAAATGGRVILQSLHVLDEDDQGTAFDIYFSSAAPSIGTINDVVAITDANARNLLGMVRVAAADFVDLVANRHATLKNIGLMMETGAAGSLWLSGAVRSGTPTYTASGLKIKLGFTRV